MTKHLELPREDPRTKLYLQVTRALKAAPSYFSSPVHIEGIPVIDLFALNGLLGGSIESQTVIILNSLRNVWDEEGNWAEYEFKRFPESFPDVRLINANNNAIALGIELKGWYLLSKEEAPSFRFRASINAIAEWDILAVYPWSLSNVISGTPILHSPFVEQALYAAECRNEYWRNRPNCSSQIIHPDTHPYPEPRSRYIDIVTDDGGNNFGRIARVPRLMDEWISSVMDLVQAGIPTKWWVKFFKLFSENQEDKEIQKQLVNIGKEAGFSNSQMIQFLSLIEQLLAIR